MTAYLGHLHTIPGNASPRTVIDLLYIASRWSAVGPTQHLGDASDTFYVIDAAAGAIKLIQQTCAFVGNIPDYWAGKRVVSPVDPRKESDPREELHRISIIAGSCLSNTAETLSLAERWGTIALGAATLGPVKLAGNVGGLYSRLQMIYRKVTLYSENSFSSLSSQKRAKCWWDIAFDVSIAVIKSFSIIGAVFSITFSSTLFLTLSTAITACDVMTYLAEKEEVASTPRPQRARQSA